MELKGGKQKMIRKIAKKIKSIFQARYIDVRKINQMKEKGIRPIF